MLKTIQIDWTILIEISQTDCLPTGKSAPLQLPQKDLLVTWGRLGEEQELTAHNYFLTGLASAVSMLQEKSRLWGLGLHFWGCLVDSFFLFFPPAPEMCLWLGKPVQRIMNYSSSSHLVLFGKDTCNM